PRPPPSSTLFPYTTLFRSAEGPPTNSVEMGLPDFACAVYRASQRPYRALFEMVWGAQAFAIQWPSDVAQVCNQPGPPPANDPMPDRKSTRLNSSHVAISYA